MLDSLAGFFGGNQAVFIGGFYSLLQDAADRLLLHNLRFWRMYWASRPAQHATMISHGSLLAALEAGDPEQAEKAMREHLVASRQLLRASL